MKYKEMQMLSESQALQSSLFVLNSSNPSKFIFLVCVNFGVFDEVQNWRLVVVIGDGEAWIMLCCVLWREGTLRVKRFQL
jgi:hypothetical protein